MSDTPDFLAERLANDGQKMADFFAGLGPDDWAQPVYGEGEGWTVRDVLAHFVSAERSFLALFESILAGGPGVPDDFEIDRFNNAQVAGMAAATSQALLDEYRDARAATAAWVEARTAEELERTGRHPFLGPTSLADMIKMVYRHNQIHLRDLRRQVGERAQRS